MAEIDIRQKIRIQLLGKDDNQALSDEYVDLMIADAKEETQITSETSKSLRYYVCYLIALNWDSIGAIASREGTTYRAPDQDKYLKIYQESLTNNLSEENSGFVFKESTDKNCSVDSNGILRSGSDL